MTTQQTPQRDIAGGLMQLGAVVGSWLLVIGLVIVLRVVL